MSRLPMHALTAFRAIECSGARADAYSIVVGALVCELVSSKRTPEDELAYISVVAKHGILPFLADDNPIICS